MRFQEWWERREVTKSIFRQEWGCSIRGSVGRRERLRAENDGIMLMTLVTPASLKVWPNGSFVALHPDSSSNPTWACDSHQTFSSVLFGLVHNSCTLLRRLSISVVAHSCETSPMRRSRIHGCVSIPNVFNYERWSWSRNECRLM